MKMLKIEIKDICIYKDDLLQDPDKESFEGLDIIRVNKDNHLNVV